MKQEIKSLLKDAQHIVDRLDNGKTYPAKYVAQRFQTAANAHTTDLLINHMSDVIIKKASQQEFISQNEIASIYDQLYGLSGGQTAFRDSLEDLLPNSRQFAKVAYPGSKTRTLEEAPPIQTQTESELSNAFSVIFSMGNDAPVSTFKPGQDRTIQKVVFNKLNSLGHQPQKIDIIETNEHYALCLASYDTGSLRKVSALIPVQITDGITREPKHLIKGGDVIDLESRNLYLYIKEQEKLAKDNSHFKFASERGDTRPAIEIGKAVIPTSLEPFTELETALMVAASKIDVNQINMAMGIISADLISFGSKTPSIKVMSSDQSGIIFDAAVPTKFGKTRIQVPVEFQNGKPLLPSKFATDSTSEKKVYDFSKAGFAQFMQNIHDSSSALKSTRDTEELNRLSYHQLVDQIVTGVSSKDYRLAEDALMSIQARFDSNTYHKAFDQFTQLLKHSSTISSKRNDFIKSAYERGDLIKVPTTIELYCPKLGLPLSKIDFDEKGRPIAKGRKSKADNQIQDTLISSGRIIFN